MTRIKFKGVCRALLATAAFAPLAACATSDMKKMSEQRPASPTAVTSAVGSEFEDTRPALRRVRLSGDFFALKPMGGEIPAEIANARVRIDFAGQQATFDDLTMLLEDRGLSVILGWDDGSYGQDAGLSTQISQSNTNMQSEGGFTGNYQSNSGSNMQRSNDTQNNGLSISGTTGLNGGFGNARSTQDMNVDASQNLGTDSRFQSGNTFVSESSSVRGDAVYNLRKRPLPFRRYEGTLGGLFRQLQRSMGVTIWWNDGIYVSSVGRYAVMLPQNRELMNQVVNELKQKGARNVVPSLQAGTVSFVAPGALAEEVIKPYLTRLGRNASEVTMQVALVSVVMSEKTARGFDWSQFSFAFGDPTTTAGNGAGNAAGGGTGGVGTGGTTGTGVGASQLPENSLFSIGKDSSRFFVKELSILGSKRPLDIAGAIKFLSTYGDTAVDQNVELRTLAGTSVNWRSGETIPYVTGVSATTTGLGGVTGGGLGGGLAGAVGSAQTDKLETGLTLNLAPSYEAAGGLVTVSFKLELTELIEFVNLSAGAQLGSFTQPRTREQKLDDIVRIPVGETVVLGGLRRHLNQLNRTGPFSAYSIGSRDRNSEIQTIFVLLRPSVTTYEIAGLDQPIPAKLNSIELGSDGRPWQAPEGVYRGSNLFGEPVNNSAEAQRRKAMRQPAKTEN